VSRVNAALSLIFPSFPFSQAASVATLPSALFVSDFRSVPVGCSRPSRCCHLIIVLRFSLGEGSWARTCSQSPKLGGRAQLFGTNSFFARLLYAAALIAFWLLHLPTTGAAVPPACALPPPPLVSWRFSLLAQRASAPSAVDHYLPQRAPERSAPPAPAAFVDTRLPPC